MSFSTLGVAYLILGDLNGTSGSLTEACSDSFLSAHFPQNKSLCLRYLEHSLLPPTTAQHLAGPAGSLQWAGKG